MGATEDEELRKAQKPRASISEVLEVALKEFGLKAAKEDVKTLDSYDDQNFLVSGSLKTEIDSDQPLKRKFLFKIHNGVESKNTSFIKAQNAVLLYLTKEGFNVSVPQKSLSGKFYADIDLTSEKKADSMGAEEKGKCLKKLKLENQRHHVVRLLTWVEGEILHDVEITSDMLTNAGQYLGRLRQALDGFSHDGTVREHLWDLQNIHFISPYIKHIDDVSVREIVQDVVNEFKNTVIPTQKELSYGVLHSDFNDSNILLDPKSLKVNGIIDFGDMVYSCKVYDLAISMAYSMIKPLPNCSGTETAANILQGYCQSNEISESEQKILRISIASRLAISITLGALSIYKDPNNEYLKRHAQPARTALCKFWTHDPQDIERIFTKAIVTGSSDKLEIG